LLNLVQKKKSVEKQIVQHVKELAEAYEQVNADFRAVLEGRSEDIHVAINTLHELQQGNTSPNEQS